MRYIPRVIPIVAVSVLALALFASGPAKATGETPVPAPGTAPTTPPHVAAAVPDDARLVDLVHLTKSGISESIINEQVKQSGRPYNLSVNDLFYLKENGVLESTIAALMATSTTATAVPGTEPAVAPAAANTAPVVAAAPETMVFDGLIMKTGWMSKNRPGRLVLEGSALTWTDGVDPKENFAFQIDGLQKVWFTCKTRSPENFCYQINFQIVKGAHYEFQDVNRESGGNATVLAVMAALRTNFPEVAYGSPKE